MTTQDKVEPKKKRRLATRCLLVVFLLTVGAVIGYTISMLVAKMTTQKTAQQSLDLCIEDRCVAAGLMIKVKLNKSVDPCQDFYQFACGGWQMEYQLKLDESFLNTFNVVQSGVNKKLLNLLSANVSDNEPNAVKLVKHFYRSCMDEASVENLGVKPLVDNIRQVLGDNIFPGALDKPNMNLTTLLIKAYELDVMPLIIIDVTEDMTNTSENIIYFDQPSLNLDRFVYFDNNSQTVLQDYTQLYVELMQHIYDKKQVQDDASHVISFEIQMANLTLPPVEHRQTVQLYNRTTLHSLNSAHPLLDWIVFLRNIFRHTKVDVDITEAEPAVVMAAPFFDRLFPLLEITPISVLLKYSIWKYVYTNSDKTTKWFSNPIIKFKNKLRGFKNSSGIIDRSYYCMLETTDNFYVAVGRMYVEKYFITKSRETVTQIIRHILQTFLDKVQKATWISEETKLGALRKAKGLDIQVGYSEKYMNNSVLDKHYGNIQMAGGYFANSVTINKQLNFIRFSKLHKPVDKTEWSASSTKVNGYYKETLNQMTFPAVTLQSPFFENWLLPSLNYGALGFVIGHEITHAFDNTGYNFDEKGNVKQWWRENDMLTFKKRTQCLVNKYNEYQDEETNLHVNGELTLGENIADHGGLDAAFKAFKHEMQNFPPQANYPTLQMFSQEQLFFIAFAQVWCQNSRKEVKVCMLNTDPHSPAKFRVLGTLRNNIDFAQAFNCPVGSPMNPANKCQVW